MYREFEEFVFNNYDFNEPAIKRKYFKVKKKKIHSNNIRLSSPLPAPKTNDDYLDLKKYLI